MPHTCSCPNPRLLLPPSPSADVQAACGGGALGGGLLREEPLLRGVVRDELVAMTRDEMGAWPRRNSRPAPPRLPLPRVPRGRSRSHRGRAASIHACGAVGTLQMAGSARPRLAISSSSDGI